MRLSRPCLVVWVIAFGVAGTAQGGVTIFAQASTSAQSGTTDNKSDTDNRPVNGLHIAASSVMSPGASGALAKASAAALAQVGSLGVFVDANVQGVAGTSGGGGTANAVSKAEWRDTNVSFNVSGAAQGTPFLVLTTVNIEGSMNAVATNAAPIVSIPPEPSLPESDSVADVALDFMSFSSDSVEVPPRNGGLGFRDENTLHGTHDSEPTPSSIVIQHTMRVGEPYRIDYFLQLIASASAGRDTAADAIGIYSNTLYWGGVQSVQNAVTGEFVTDWTLTSEESGFDYSQPFAVPEPSSILLLGTGLCAWLA